MPHACTTLAPLRPMLNLDAIALLRADHDAIVARIDDYERLVEDGAGPDERHAQARALCLAWTLHTAMEEAVLYPAARGLLGERCRALDTASVEHDVTLALVAEIELMDADEPLYDARVCVLGDYIKHHIAEEEDDLLLQMAEAEADFDVLGERLASVRTQLLASLQAPR